MVWLNLKNIRTTRLSKKFDWKNSKFQITRVRDTHFVELDVLGPTKSFYINLLRPASTDPLPSQVIQNSFSAPIIVRDENENEDHLEWIIEAIQDEYVRKRKVMYTVKWKGFQGVTVEPEKHVVNTIALTNWLDLTSSVRTLFDKLRYNWRRTLNL